MSKVRSLAACLPLGAFLVTHLAVISSAVAGRAAFDARIALLPGGWVGAVELFGVAIPLAWSLSNGHTRAQTASAEAQDAVPQQSGDRQEPRDVLPLLWTLTGVGALAFLAWHLWQFHIRVLTRELAPRDLYDELCAQLSSTAPWGLPLAGFGVLLGLMCSTMYLYHGLVWAGDEWNLTRSRRATRWVTLGAAFLSIGLGVVGASSLLHFAVGWPSL